MDALLQQLRSPGVEAEALVLGAALAGLALIVFRLTGSCDRAAQTCAQADSDCHQVLDLVHRIPGLG